MELYVEKKYSIIHVILKQGCYHLALQITSLAGKESYIYFSSKGQRGGYRRALVSLHPSSAGSSLRSPALVCSFYWVPFQFCQSLKKERWWLREFMDLFITCTLYLEAIHNCKLIIKVQEWMSSRLPDLLPFSRWCCALPLLSVFLDKTIVALFSNCIISLFFLPCYILRAV